MKATKIQDFLPDSPGELTIVNARIPVELKRQMDKALQATRKTGSKVTWKAFIEASCRHYLATVNKKSA